jgi:hypothetical protein
MAAGRLPKPGTEHGPCPSPCKHTDCEQTRDMAALLCRVCEEPIGYDRRFYIEPDTKRYVHALCVED